jgi:hypothetical protein
MSTGGSLESVYENLPQPVVEFSADLEYAVAELLEMATFEVPEGRGAIPFLLSDETVLTRGGGPPVLLPQNRKFHEFDVLTHLDRAAYCAEHYIDVILPELSADTQVSVRDLLRASDTAPFVVAAELHDIEKVFNVSSVDYLHPSMKHRERVRLNLLEAGTLEDKTKLGIQRHFLFGNADSGPESSKFSRMQGYFEKASVDVDKVWEILEVYNWIDGYIIRVAEETVDYEEFIRSFAAFSKDMDRTSVVFGALTMIADNLAQGNPPEKDAKFDDKVKENIHRCQVLIESVL